MIKGSLLVLRKKEDLDIRLDRHIWRQAESRLTFIRRRIVLTNNNKFVWTQRK